MCKYLWWLLENIQSRRILRKESLLGKLGDNKIQPKRSNRFSHRDAVGKRFLSVELYLFLVDSLIINII